MAGELEEITMMPYQIYKALTDERTREVVAAAERPRLPAEGQYSSTDTDESAPTVKAVTARTVAPPPGRRGSVAPVRCWISTGSA